MTEFDWVKALDAMNRGHNFVGVTAVREMMAAVGITGLPLHSTEVEEVKRLRAAANRNLRAATEIEARAVPDEISPSDWAARVAPGWAVDDVST
jgi:hypothetical protein